MIAARMLLKVMGNTAGQRVDALMYKAAAKGEPEKVICDYPPAAESSFSASATLPAVSTLRLPS